MVLERLPIPTFFRKCDLSMFNSGNACQNHIMVLERLPNDEFWFGSQVKILIAYSNSRSINIAFSPGVMSSYAASVGSHTFGRPGGGQKCGPRRRPPMCIHFPQVLGTVCDNRSKLMFSCFRADWVLIDYESFDRCRLLIWGEKQWDLGTQIFQA